MIVNNKRAGRKKIATVIVHHKLNLKSKKHSKRQDKLSFVEDFIDGHYGNFGKKVRK